MSHELIDFYMHKNVRFHMERYSYSCIDFLESSNEVKLIPFIDSKYVLQKELRSYCKHNANLIERMHMSVMFPSCSY